MIIILFSLENSPHEVMSIGRSFQEAFQEALRMVNENITGFDPLSRTIRDDIRLIKDFLEFLLYFVIGINHSY